MLPNGIDYQRRGLEPDIDLSYAKVEQAASRWYSYYDDNRSIREDFLWPRRGKIRFEDFNNEEYTIAGPTVKNNQEAIQRLPEIVASFKKTLEKMDKRYRLDSRRVARAKAHAANFRANICDGLYDCALAKTLALVRNFRLPLPPPTATP